jgi:predicted nucleic acid-binding Zn ribbon protein
MMETIFKRFGGEVVLAKGGGMSDEDLKPGGRADRLLERRRRRGELGGMVAGPESRSRKEPVMSRVRTYHEAKALIKSAGRGAGRELMVKRELEIAKQALRAAEPTEPAPDWGALRPVIEKMDAQALSRDPDFRAAMQISKDAIHAGTQGRFAPEPAPPTSPVSKRDHAEAMAIANAQVKKWAPYDPREQNERMQRLREILP